MKVKIKDLKPNPFRDFENYPRDEEKIEVLMKSVKKTGFWDNILARRKNGKYEIAYGHHRYVVLKRLCNPENEVDIPVKELDDWTMIMIMIDENMEQYRTNPAVQNEGVKAAFEYMKISFPLKEMKLKTEKYTSMVIVFDGLPIPEKFKTSYVAAQIAEKLGDIRKEKRIYLSLQQLEASGEIKIPKVEEPEVEEPEVEESAEDETKKETEKAKPKKKKKKKKKKTTVELSKSAVKILGKTSYVDRFFNTLQRLFKKQGIKIPKEKQLAVAKKLVSMAKFDTATMAKELVKSVQEKKDGAKEDKVVELEAYLRESSNLIGRLDKRVQIMLEIKDVLDSEIYVKSVEKTEFKIKAAFLIRNLKKLLGGKIDGVRKLSGGRK